MTSGISYKRIILTMQLRSLFLTYDLIGLNSDIDLKSHPNLTSGGTYGHV